MKKPTTSKNLSLVPEEDEFKDSDNMSNVKCRYSNIVHEFS